MSALDNLRNAAKRWLKALRANDAGAIARLRRAFSSAPERPVLRDVQYALARERGYDSWKSLRDAQNPDVARYANIARDIVTVHESGDVAALGRLQEHFGQPFTAEQFRDGVSRRLAALDEALRPAGPFGLLHAQLLVAREAGYDTWNTLTKTLHTGGVTADSRSPDAYFTDSAKELTAPMITPLEMRAPLPVRLPNDPRGTTSIEIWNMLTACREGDLEGIALLVDRCPDLVLCTYNYMAPLHLAVREGHLHIVRFLADRGAANPKYVTYPYRESLVTVARDRGLEDIALLLEQQYRTGDSNRKEDEGGEILYEMDDTHRRFQKLLNSNSTGEVEAILKDRPDLALNPYTFWGEGALMMPAKLGHQHMVELLLRYGASVPTISKWGAWYYLWHLETAAFLLDHGMSPDHMNCHHTTVLHDMAYKGDTKKAMLLLDHGATLNAIDEEFQSTPLGLAARWGHRDMVTLLLSRGADPNMSGAAWSSPLAWAVRKGHADIQAILRDAGAQEARWHR